MRNGRTARQSDMSEMLDGRPERLDNGTWGVAVGEVAVGGGSFKLAPNVGDIVRVHPRTGRGWEARITAVLYRWENRYGIYEHVCTTSPLATDE